MSISVLILLAWFSHIDRLPTVLPFAFEMKVNAAIGFAAAAAALVALLRGRRRLSSGFALVTLVIGIATILEYLGAPVSVDELLIVDWSGVPGSHPGRPAPNTATIFILFAAIFLVLDLTRSGWFRNAVAQFVPLAILALGFETLAGHIGQSGFALSWWTLQPMSIPSAICTLILGGGLLAQGWQVETARIARMPLWLPLLFCFAVALLDIYTPLEVDVGILFVPLVLCALWFERAMITLAFASIATLLILFGLFASPRGQIAFEAAATNRALAIGCVWVVAALVYAQHGARKRLRQSEHHFAAAQQIATIGSFEMRFRGMRLRGSDAFVTMHGLDSRNYDDWESFLRNSIPPDERRNVEEMVSAARAGTRSRDLDYSFIRPDGIVRNGVMHCDLLFDAAGAPAGIIGVVHDVTDILRAQARHADLEAQLRHAQKLEALGTLAGSIAHDLNNTLVPITTLAPLLVESAQPSDRQVLDIILDAARRAKELVREMLVFSRKDDPAPEAFRLDLLVGEALVIVRAGVPASIGIVQDLSPVPEILGRKGQIYQTILNLVTNAAQAIGDRAGTITIGVSAALDSDGRPADVRLYVADDGPGMDPQTAQRIFEPYFSTKAATVGTGLGLAIVSGIVKSHGGSIVVRSAVGEGTRFDLLFPAQLQPSTVKEIECV
jgi:PAS domain S-box-containing protein